MASGEFLDPRLVDLALALIALEGLGLLAFRAWTARGPAPIALIANLLAGGFILVALRSTLAGADLVWIGAALAASLLAHVVDLASRWEARPSPITGPRITRGAISLRATRRHENPAPKAPDLEAPHA